MKTLLNPIPRLIIGGVCFLIALLDGAMRQCEQSYDDFFQCLSWIGTWSCYIILFIIATFVVEFMIWPLAKWLYGKLMSAVTL